MKKIGVSEFVKRQTKDSKFSYYNGAWENLVNLVEKNFDNQDKGYKDGVVLINVPSENFFTSIVKLNKGDELNATFASRQDFEEPVISVTVKNKEKMPAKVVKIVLYRYDVLAEDNNNSGDYEWEIISINAQPYDFVPMNPVTMMRNELHLPGGTSANYTKEEYLKAIHFWSHHADVSE